MGFPARHSASHRPRATLNCALSESHSVISSRTPAAVISFSSNPKNPMCVAPCRTISSTSLQIADSWGSPNLQSTYQGTMEAALMKEMEVTRWQRL